MAVEGRSARSGRVRGGGGLSLRFQDFGDVGLKVFRIWGLQTCGCMAGS